jgi:riboflavin kinase/FMN adenylyltransferase
LLWLLGAPDRVDTISLLLCVTIGNFDGVHVGHRALIDRARRVAGPSGRVVAVTFEPHPLRLLRPELAPQNVQLPAERRQALIDAGVDEVRVLEVNRTLLQREATDFLAWLRTDTGFDAIVEGPDFHFGKGRGGDVPLLRREGSRLGFAVEVVEPVQVQLSDGATAAASSSLLRWLLSHGRVEDAARVLGRPYGFAGLVIRGDQRGREIGWPTANIEHGDRLLPADGVYAGTAELPDRTRRRAAISVGTKPTFGDAERTVEAFLLDHEAPLDQYGWRLSVTFDRWLREQSRFDAVEPLLAQMRRDVVRTRVEIPVEALAS